MMLILSSNSCSVITRGGVNLIMWSCVGLASSPLSRSFRHTFHASKPVHNKNEIVKYKLNEIKAIIPSLNEQKKNKKKTKNKQTKKTSSPEWQL